MRDFDWEIIVTLYKTQNVTKAAEMLFISQPTLTKRLQIIEDELGIRFVVRNKQGAFFTPEGERIARQAAEIVAMIQSVRKSIVENSCGSRGILRLGVPHTYMRFILPTLLEKFSSQYQDVALDILSQLSNELVQRVEEDLLDFCFARYSPENPELEKLVISEDQMYAVYNQPFSIDELPNLPLIEYEKNPMTFARLQKWWDEKFSVPKQVRFKVNNADSCLSMVQQGLGYAFFSDQNYFLYEAGVFYRPLVYQDGSSFTRKAYLVYKPSVSSDAVALNFLNFVRNMDFNRLTKEKTP